MLNHKGTKTLESERLILRKLKIDDATNMYNNWASDNEVSKYLPWNTHKNIEETKKILNMWIAEYKEDNIYNWGIEVKNNSELIGTITVMHIDERCQIAEIGYCIGKNYWGKGYINEANDIVIKYLFDEIGINRIQAKHHLNNVNSGKVLEKSGFKFEGILRDYDIDNNGNYVDVKMYSIIKRDYKKD